MQASTGCVPADLRTPPAPASLQPLLDTFNEIASARRSGFCAPEPLAWGEIEAWCRLSATALAPWQVQVLRLLDQAWLMAWRHGQPTGGESRGSRATP